MSTHSRHLARALSNPRGRRAGLGAALGWFRMSLGTSARGLVVADAHTAAQPTRKRHRRPEYGTKPVIQVGAGETTAEHGVPRDVTVLGNRRETNVGLRPPHPNGVGAYDFDVGCSHLSAGSRCLKRSLDLVIAVPAGLLLLPLMLLLAAAIKLDSPGPVLFRQRRIGKGGRAFFVTKFRTMVVGAEAMTEELLPLSKDPNWLLLDHDPRLTRLGRVLRTSSLDELPQLWNVVKGEMSLVGPRPLVEPEYALLTGCDRVRGAVPPGLTGLWQVMGRTSISFEEMITLDCLYVSNWSLWRDLQLLFRTIPVVLTRRGAN